MNQTDRSRISGRRCDCGYLATGTPPARLCFDCGDRALADWVAEEKSVLGPLPSYAVEVAEIIRDAAKNQAAAIKKRSNEPFAEAARERSQAARRLSRVRRAHRRELDGVSLDRWQAAAALLGSDPRELFRKESKRFVKRGLGAAQLTALGADAMQIVVKTAQEKRR
ncbi:hypothetical protein [Microbacterium aurugineum]|uniref:hypothetical protein n=1 Tax=Microbacterium aurugineum TaxID=2851642 RepID=UPI0020C06D74|nr:hypothetical protein [Microbacterium aurugineum]MCK8476299.1 hypothetical protein [Microbacterium aurugineum]